MAHAHSEEHTVHQPAKQTAEIVFGTLPDDSLLHDVTRVPELKQRLSGEVLCNRTAGVL